VLLAQLFAELSFDRVKIDRSFVSDIKYRLPQHRARRNGACGSRRRTSSAPLRTVKFCFIVHRRKGALCPHHNLAKGLGMSAKAEGVEAPPPCSILAAECRGICSNFSRNQAPAELPRTFVRSEAVGRVSLPAEGQSQASAEGYSSSLLNLPTAFTMAPQYPSYSKTARPSTRPLRICFGHFPTVRPN